MSSSSRHPSLLHPGQRALLYPSPDLHWAMPKPLSCCSHLWNSEWCWRELCGCSHCSPTWLLAAALVSSLLTFSEPLSKCSHFLEAPNIHQFQMRSANDLICFRETGTTPKQLLSVPSLLDQCFCPLTHPVLLFSHHLARAFLPSASILSPPISSLVYKKMVSSILKI